MTDAERMEKAWRAEVRANPNGVRSICQRLIDSGLVTVNPPPDPAEQIALAMDMAGDFEAHVRGVQRAIASGHITPGPQCEGVERPQADVPEEGRPWLTLTLTPSPPVTTSWGPCAPTSTSQW